MEKTTKEMTEKRKLYLQNCNSDEISVREIIKMVRKLIKSEKEKTRTYPIEGKQLLKSFDNIRMYKKNLKFYQSTLKDITIHIHSKEEYLKWKAKY